MKRIVISFVVALFFAVPSLYAQTFFQTVDGKCYWTDEEIEQGKEITGKQGMRITRIQASDIVLIEHIERGAEVLKPDKIKPVAPVAFSGRVEDFCAAGKKVYVPVASNSVQQRWGAKRLSENLLGDGHWQIVGSAEQADFLVEYVFDPRGSDKAYLRLTDRAGKLIRRTHSVSARDWSAEDAGKESAEELYEDYLKGEFYDNNLKHWGFSDWTWNDRMFVNVGVRAFGDFEIEGFEIDDFSPNVAVDALFSYRINNFAFGGGLEYQTTINDEKYGDMMSSLSPYVHATLYINHWNPTFFRLRVGFPIPIKNAEWKEDRSEYHIVNTTKDSYSRPWFMVSYGRQWRNLSLEFIIGLRSVQSESKEIGIAYIYRYDDIDRYFNAGLELTYKIPLSR